MAKVRVWFHSRESVKDSYKTLGKSNPYELDRYPMIGEHFDVSFDSPKSYKVEKLIHHFYEKSESDVEIFAITSGVI